MDFERGGELGGDANRHAGMHVAGVFMHVVSSNPPDFLVRRAERLCIHQHVMFIHCSWLGSFFSHIVMLPGKESDPFHCRSHFAPKHGDDSEESVRVDLKSGL